MTTTAPLVSVSDHLGRPSSCLGIRGSSETPHRQKAAEHFLGLSDTLLPDLARVMEGRARRPPVKAVARSTAAEVKTPPPLQPNITKGYFSVESFLVLLCLTASLLILPVVLPPLPPPPLLLLLVPIGILAVLLVLALMPSDVRDIASPYL